MKFAVNCKKGAAFTFNKRLEMSDTFSAAAQSVLSLFYSCVLFSMECYFIFIAVR